MIIEEATPLPTVLCSLIDGMDQPCGWDELMDSVRMMTAYNDPLLGRRTVYDYGGGHVEETWKPLPLRSRLSRYENFLQQGPEPDLLIRHQFNSILPQIRARRLD